MEDEIFDETKVDDRTDKEYEYLLFLFEQLLDKFDNQTIDLEGHVRFRALRKEIWHRP